MQKNENLDVRLPVSLFNNLSKDQFGARPFSLSPNGFGSLALSMPMLNLAADGLHSTATISVANIGEFDMDVLWSGQDLAVNQVKIDPKIVACTPGDSNCEGLNTLRRQMASTYAANLTTQFKGSLLRPNDWSHGIDLSIFGIPMHLSVQGNHASIIGKELQFVNVTSVDMDGTHENH